VASCEQLKHDSKQRDCVHSMVQPTWEKGVIDGREYQLTIVTEDTPEGNAHKLI